jgi:DNA replication protein DnaC
MQRHEILCALRALKLAGMACAFDELTARHAPNLPMGAWMAHLIQSEQAERQIRTVRYQMDQANSPMPRDLDTFDYGQSILEKAQVTRLSGVEFMDKRHNLIFVGGTGTGKTRLAIALARAAIRSGRRVRFFSAVDMVNQLEREQASGRAGRLAFRLLSVDAVVLDELGYLPFSQNGGALLFRLISRLYERTSPIITTNLAIRGMGASHP